MKVAKKNTFDFGGGFNITAEELVDSRTAVGTVADLTKAETWEGMRMPNDIRVTVHADSSIWVLKDKTNITDLKKGWVCVGYSEAKIREFAQDEAANAVRFVVSGASEAFDTLKETEDWIKAHSGAAISMIEDINTLSGAIQTINDTLGELDYDEKGAAEQALEDAKQYTDDEISKLSASTTIADLQKQIDELSNLIGFIDAPGHVVIIRPDDNWTITFENTTSTGGGDIDDPEDGPIFNPVEELPILDLTCTTDEYFPYNKNNSSQIDFVDRVGTTVSQTISLRTVDDTDCYFNFTGDDIDNNTGFEVNVSGYKPVTFQYNKRYVTVYLVPTGETGDSYVMQNSSSFYNPTVAAPMSVTEETFQTNPSGGITIDGTIVDEGGNNTGDNNEFVGDLDKDLDGPEDNNSSIETPGVLPETKYVYGYIYLKAATNPNTFKVTVTEGVDTPVSNFDVYGEDVLGVEHSVTTTSSGTCLVTLNTPAKIYIDSNTIGYKAQTKYVDLTTADLTILREPQKNGEIIFPDNPSIPDLVEYTATIAVIDENGDPLVGASCINDKTGYGVITDVGGVATLNCIGDTTIRISYVGYKSKSVTVTEDRHRMFVQMDIKVSEN